MVLEVQERGRYLLKACTKCGGDLILGAEELYCFQCGGIVYNAEDIDYNLVRRSSDGYRLKSIHRGARYLEKRKDIVKLLVEGETDNFIADTLGISRRVVNEVRLVLKDTKGD